MLIHFPMKEFNCFHFRFYRSSEFERPGSFLSIHNCCNQYWSLLTITIKNEYIYARNLNDGWSDGESNSLAYMTCSTKANLNFRWQKCEMHWFNRSSVGQIRTWWKDWTIKCMSRLNNWEDYVERILSSPSVESFLCKIINKWAVKSRARAK